MNSNKSNEQLLFDSFDDNFDDYVTEDFLNYLNDESAEHPGFVVTGDLSLWNGDHSIEPELFIDLEEAYNACLGRDTEDIVAYMDKNGDYIKLECYHHDGTNVFYIRALTDEAVVMFNEYLDGIEDDATLEFLNEPESFETLNFY